MMKERDEIVVVKGTVLTEEDKFYISWGRESLRNNLVFANEVLRQLVTLNSVLLGGSIAFLDTTVIATSYKLPVVIAFLLSLIISCLGVMPYERHVDLRQPNQIKQHKENALKSKRTYLWSAGLLLVLGFGIALVGIIGLYV